MIFSFIGKKKTKKEQNARVIVCDLYLFISDRGKKNRQREGERARERILDDDDDGNITVCITSSIIKPTKTSEIQQVNNLPVSFSPSFSFVFNQINRVTVKQEKSLRTMSMFSSGLFLPTILF